MTGRWMVGYRQELHEAIQFLSSLFVTVNLALPSGQEADAREGAEEFCDTNVQPVAFSDIVIVTVG